MNQKQRLATPRPGQAENPWTNADLFRESFALVIPTLREAANIECLIRRTCAALDPLPIDYEVIIVDDDSCDGIASVVTALRADCPRIRLVTRIGERGLSGAVLHGWASTNAAIVGVMDADMQHPPELLPELLHAMRLGKDLVIASRYSGEGDVGDWNLFRRLTSRAAALLTLPLQRTGVRVQDPLSGFFLVRRRCLQRHNYQRYGFKLLLEILIASRIQTVQEVPFAFGSRRWGQSKANWKIAVQFAFLLGRLYLSKYSRVLRMSNRKPRYLSTSGD